MRKKFRVHLVAIAEHTVEVDATDGDQAVHLALLSNLPGVNISNRFALNEWTTASEVWPDKDPEDDYEELG